MDNYELAVETAEKCCQANTQFAEISEVSRGGRRTEDKQRVTYLVPAADGAVISELWDRFTAVSN